MLALLLATAQAAPLLVRAAVIVSADEEVRPTSVARTDTDLRALLQDSLRYQVLSPELTEGRLGHVPQELVERCGERSACWTEAGRRLGVDQIVVAQLEPDWVGPKVRVLLVDVGASRLRTVTTHLPQSGGAPLELADDLFFGQGTLVVEVSPSPYVLELDGHDYGAVQGPWVADPAAAGKHVLRIEREGSLPFFQAVMVYPGFETVVEVELAEPPPPPPQRLRWGPWAASALVVGGVAALWVTRDAPGSAY